MFTGLERLVQRSRWAVLALGGAAMLLGLLLGLPVLGKLDGGNPDFVTPGSGSDRASARVEEATGGVPDGGLVVLVDTGRPIDDPGTAALLREVTGLLAAEPALTNVSPPTGPGSPQVAEDGASSYVSAQWRSDAAEEIQPTIDRLTEELAGEDRVHLGGSEVVGNQVVNTVHEDLARAELLAFPLLFVLSVLIFRSLVAAGIPLLIGGLNIVVSMLGIRLVDQVHDMSIFSLNLVTALGLGLAIDYSLLVISRFRAALAAGCSVAAALGVTMHTAGRTVVYSALTVAAAMASLFVFDQRFLVSMAVGGILVTLVGAVAALTVLPALLAVLGTRIDALAPRRWRRQLEEPHATTGTWFRLGRAVVASPWPTAALGVLVLLVLSLPFLRVEFTTVGAKDLPTASSSRFVDDALSRDFATNPTEAVLVVAGEGDAADPAAEVDRLRTTLGNVAGVKAVSPPLPLDGTTWLLAVDPQGPALDTGTADLVTEIRGLPTPLDVDVGGQSAGYVDLRASLADRLPYAVLLVLASTMLVLWLMTGSVLLPLNSVLMNALTLGATFGVLVWVFQDGRFEWLLGHEAQGALDATQPVLLFALVFGLSTDYGVFLLSRIREEREAGASDREAVVRGVGRSGRIITAAAVLFCVALGALVTSDIVFIKELGLGTALGVLVDATIVRILLVPSLMSIQGRWNWWSPGPLARLHRRVGLREGPAPGVVPAPVPEPVRYVPRHRKERERVLVGGRHR